MRHLVALGLLSGALQAAPDFARDIRPLLEQHCVKCHGPEKQKGGLRFDTREGAFKTADSGDKPFIPGHADQSRLVRLVTSTDPEEWMPPKGERVPSAHIELLKQWINAGAHWPQNVDEPVVSELAVTAEDRKHWAYLPLQSVSIPTTQGQNPVDRFIRARLDEKRLSPATEAHARTLVRRIYFDLIGLPPTPAEVDDILKAPNVPRLADRLLANPHYGERWARHWLDVARYADSDGQEGDQDRPTAYHYRDFVIRALNDDMPFDTFLRWQLAGDELEPDNPLAIAATGFIVAGPHTVLDVPMEEERVRNRFNELDDMIATTGTAMLGLTLGCARCHDHKYDAIPTRDYYRLMSAFNGGNRAEVPLAPLADARAYREADRKWKAELAVRLRIS